VESFSATRKIKHFFSLSLTLSLSLAGFLRK